MIHHVYPLNDLKEHEIKGHDCWCRPELEELSGGDLVIHNSLDRRELYENMVH